MKISKHSKERACERLFGEVNPTTEQLVKIEKWLLESVVWNPLRERFEIPEFNAVFVIENDVVVTIIVEEKAILNHKKVSDFQKTHNKVWCRRNRDDRKDF